jgi:hypothetical protein
MLKMTKLCYFQQYFGHLPFISFFVLILLKDNDLLFLKIFWILIAWGFFIQILSVNNSKLFLIIFWVFLYPNINNE